MKEFDRAPEYSFSFRFEYPASLALHPQHISSIPLGHINFTDIQNFRCKKCIQKRLPNPDTSERSERELLTGVRLHSAADTAGGGEAVAVERRGERAGGRSVARTAEVYRYS